MFEEKEIGLKNDKSAILSFTKSLDNTGRLRITILAKNHNKKIVGTCNFNMRFEYRRPFTENEKKYVYESEVKRIGEEIANKIVEEGRRCFVSLNNKELEKYQISGETLIDDDEVYKYYGSTMYLDWLEVKDEAYINTGIGKALWNEVESIAKQCGCSMITGRVMPFGKFASRTVEFYKSVGYNLQKEPDDYKVYGEKKLENNEKSITIDELIKEYKKVELVVQKEDDKD